MIQNSPLFYDQKTEKEAIFQERFMQSFEELNKIFSNGLDFERHAKIGDKQVGIIKLDSSTCQSEPLKNLANDGFYNLLYATIVPAFYNKISAHLDEAAHENFHQQLYNITSNSDSVPLITSATEVKSEPTPSKYYCGGSISAYSHTNTIAIRSELFLDENNYAAFKEVIKNLSAEIKLFESASAAPNFVNIEIPLEGKPVKNGHRQDAQISISGSDVPHVSDANKFGIIVETPDKLFSYKKLFKGHPQEKSLDNFFGSSSRQIFYDSIKSGLVNLLKDYNVKESDISLNPLANEVGHKFAESGIAIRFDVKHMHDAEFVKNAPNLMQEIDATIQKSLKTAMSEYIKLTKAARNLNDISGWNLFQNSNSHQPGYNSKGNAIVSYNGVTDLAGKVDFLKEALSLKAEQLSATNPDSRTLEKLDLSKQIKVTDNNIIVTKELAKILSDVDFKAVNEKLKDQVLKSLSPEQSQSKA